MHDDDKCPDIIPGTPPEGWAKLEPIQGMRRIPPQIRWGEDYKSWPVHKRLDYAERLASSMNHAADLLQKERNAGLERIAAQEAQLKHAAKVYADQGDLMHRELGRADAEKQQLYSQIVALQGQVKELQKRVRDLEGA